jgi:cardiolipin synthase
MSPRTPVPADARFTVPNVVTVLRILMAVLAAACFATGRALELAVFLCIAAALLDIFDGWYARAFSQCSHLGEHLDPLADKLLMAVVYGVIAVAMSSGVIWVLTGLIALRELAMTVFRSYSLRRHQRFIPANRLGKVKMILQSTVGLAILAYAYLINGGFAVRESFVAAPMLVILIVSWFSAAVYVRNWNTARSVSRRRAATIPVDGFEETNRMVVGK